MANNKQIMVERETFERNGKSYFTYFIRGKIRDKEIRVALMPPDRGGYTVLDIVFGNDNQVPLTCTPFEMTDEKTGRVIKGNTYSVVTTDAEGKEYECKIMPFRNSDKMLLNMLLK